MDQSMDGGTFALRDSYIHTYIQIPLITAYTSYHTICNLFIYLPMQQNANNTISMSILPSILFNQGRRKVKFSNTIYINKYIHTHTYIYMYIYMYIIYLSIYLRHSTPFPPSICVYFVCVRFDFRFCFLPLHSLKHLGYLVVAGNGGKLPEGRNGWH